MSKKIAPRKQPKKVQQAIPSSAGVLPLAPVVGSGASAGGLEAFRDLLEALPNDTGMAFVLVSHLSKTHKSMLGELLSKVTKMSVAEVRGETPILANHI